MAMTGPDGQLLLCIDCNLKMMQALALQQDAQFRVLNMLHADMEFALPVPIQLPRYPVRQFNTVQGVTMNNINIDRSTIGVLNTGSITTLDAAVTVLNQQDQQALATGIKQFTESVASSDLSPEAKNELLELLSALSAEATAPKESRRPALLRPLLKEIATLAGGAAGLGQLWTQLSPLFQALFQ